MPGFTEPFNIGIVPKKLTDEELARAIRLDIAAELDAINLYEAHIAATDNEHAKRVIAHITQEEREHTAEFLALLKELDSRQVDAENEVRGEFPRVEAGLPVDEAPEPEAKPAPGFTVGSLIRKEQTP